MQKITTHILSIFFEIKKLSFITFRLNSKLLIKKKFRQKNTYNSFCLILSMVLQLINSFQFEFIEYHFKFLIFNIKNYLDKNPSYIHNKLVKGALDGTSQVARLYS